MMRINIFGDFVPIFRGVEAIANGVAISPEILKDIRNCDYNIVNLEAPVVDNPDTAKPIFKSGPNLHGSKETIRYLQQSGFQMVTLANNHFYDYGNTGVVDTLAACKQYGIYTVGGGRNIEDASQPQIVEIKGLKIGIVNICEHEFSIANAKHGGANPIDPVANFYQIEALKPSVDRIILIIHCGTEHYHLPSLKTKRLCHYYADLGADAIVCHHAHQYSGYEVYKDTPIFYGLGNFYFDKGKKEYSGWNEGYYVTLEINDSGTAFSMHPYTQCYDEPVVSKMSEKGTSEFQTNVKHLNAVIANDEQLETEFQNWADGHYRYYLSSTFTCVSRLLKGLYRHHLLPPMTSRKQEVALYNHIICESHRDILQRVIEQYLKI